MSVSSELIINFANQNKVPKKPWKHIDILKMYKALIHFLSHTVLNFLEFFVPLKFKVSDPLLYSDL